MSKPKRKTRSTATPAKSAKPQTSQVPSSSKDVHVPPKDEKRGSAKSFCLWSSSHKQPRFKTKAGQMAPSKEQTINWLKSYEKKLREDAERARRLTKNIDVLIEFKQNKVKEWKEKETIVTNAAAADSEGPVDVEEMLKKLGDQISVDFLGGEEYDYEIVDEEVNEVD